MSGSVEFCSKEALENNQWGQEEFTMSHSCSTSSPGGDLVDGSPPAANGMATFDGLVPRRCLHDRDEILHAGFYWHELAYRINGMSVACLGTEDTPEGSSILFGSISG